MSAISSLLSTTAVTLPGTPAPNLMTALAPFPDLVLSQVDTGAEAAPIARRQAIAGSGNTLPVASGDADALAWLGSTIGGMDDAVQPGGRASAAASWPAAEVSDPQPVARATIATPVSPDWVGISLDQPAPPIAAGTDSIARPVAALPGRHLATAAVTNADGGTLPIPDASSGDATPVISDDGALADTQQADTAKDEGIGSPPTMLPAALPPITPASPQPGAPRSIEQPAVSRDPPSIAKPQPGALAPSTGLTNAASITLGAASEPTREALLQATLPDDPDVSFPAATGPQPASAAFARIAISIPRQTPSAPRMGTPVRASHDGASSDMTVAAASPLSSEAGASAAAGEATPGSDARVDELVTADRPVSSRAPSALLQAPAAVPQPNPADVSASAAGAASSDVTDASASTGTRAPLRVPKSRSSTTGEAAAPEQTLVAGAEARVSPGGGVPLSIAAAPGPAAAIAPALSLPRLSPALPPTRSPNVVPGIARDFVTSTTIARAALTPPPGAAAALPVGGAGAVASPLPIAAPGEQAVPRRAVALTATVRDAAPIAPATRTTTDVPAPTTRPTSAPAAQVFAAAIHRALGEDARQPGDPMPAPLALAIPGIAAAGAAQQGALDMRHEHWPAAMIERIVTLRDMAAENDTRLRLSPDMLGTIDVSLKRDGDQVQVQITAEQAQTRQLLAEAQPRLNELADARGVKLQLTGGHGGGADQPSTGTGGDASRQHAPATPFFDQPRSAEHGATDDTDQRIA